MEGARLYDKEQKLSEGGVALKEKKNKKSGDIMYRIIMTILIIIIAVCCIKLGKIFYEYYVGKKAYDSIADRAGAAGDELIIDWDELEKENDDIVAWLYSKGTVINYPVVQGDDNQFYLTHMFNKQWNGKGTLFVDTNCEDPFNGFNTIVYGHRMKDGSMFRSIVEYRDKKGYFDEHRKMILLTKDQRYNLEIFAASRIPQNSELYNMTFYSDDEKAAYLANVASINQIPDYDGSVNVGPSDRIVMMSTCTREVDDNRIVVWGKLVEQKSKKTKN